MCNNIDKIYWEKNMKIKDVYHYLNVMSTWENMVRMNMNNPDLYVKTTELHKKSSIIPTEQDEEREIVKMKKEYSYIDLLNLWEAIIEEKKKIYALIEQKKIEKNLPDSIMSLNKSYRSIIENLTYVSRQSETKVSTRKETGYIKGTDGVGSYTYDVDVTTEPKYESKFFLDNLDKFTKIADDNSQAIDMFNTNEDIDYVPKWSIYSKLDDLLGK